MSSSPVPSTRNETLGKFQRDVGRLLTERDRDYLHDVLKDFQACKSVENLVTSLKSCLDTPKKMDLLVDIRHLLSSSYRSKFDTLAPYHQMSKPFRPPNQTHPIRKCPSTNSLKTNLSASFRVVNLNKTTPDSTLGFSIRGGHEFGTGVYISTVDENCSARKQGLCAGDQVIECNGVNFENITHSSAVQLLSSTAKVKLVVKSEGRVPEFNEIKSGFSWVDSYGSPVKDTTNSSDGSERASSEHHSLEYHPNITLLNSMDEKRINFTINGNGNGFIGFNLRGGKEYGLGIYVSKVDGGSAPEQAGLQVGDLILNVNGTCFENIVHEEAVDLIKSQEHIMMTVKSVGILPTAKLFYSDVSWIYPDGTAANVSGESKRGMLSLSLPDNGFQDLLRRSDSSTQVDFTDTSPSPAHSDVGIQAEIPEKDFDQAVDRRVFTSTPTQTPEPQSPLREATETPVRTSQENGVQCETIPVPDSNTYEVLQSVSPFLYNEKTKTAKLKGGDDESTWSANDRSSNGSGISNEDILSRSTDNEDGHKNKVKKSKSFLQKQGDKIKAKLSFRKKGQGKPKICKKGDKDMMGFVDERCRKLLVADEYNDVMSQIKKYKGQEEDVEGLVNNLLLTLDTPRKAILLRDIRAIVIQYDLGRYDAMISNIEVEALEFYGNEAPAVEISDVTSKPKKTLVEAVQDSHGNFLLRTTSEAEQIKKQREELKKERLALKCLGSSILEREVMKNGETRNGLYGPGRNTFETGPTIQVIDSSSDSPGLSTFGVRAVGSDLPTVEVTDMSLSNPGGGGGFLTVPDRVALEYRDEEDERQKENYFSFDLPKIRTSVGISISGGCGSRAQPEIRIEKVFPGGAAADDGTLQSGWELISIDEETLQGVTHAEAVDVIRRAYNDKSQSVMRIVCVKN